MRLSDLVLLNVLTCDLELMKNHQAAEFILHWLFQETFSSAYAVLLTMVDAKNIRRIVTTINWISPLSQVLFTYIIKCHLYYDTSW